MSPKHIKPPIDPKTVDKKDFSLPPGFDKPWSTEAYTADTKKLDAFLAKKKLNNFYAEIFGDNCYYRACDCNKGRLPALIAILAFVSVVAWIVLSK